MLDSDRAPFQSDNSDQQRLPIDFDKLVNDHVRKVEDRNADLTLRLHKALSELEQLKKINQRLTREQVRSELPARRDQRHDDSVSIEEFQNRLKNFEGVPVFLIKKSTGKSVVQHLQKFVICRLDFSNEFDAMYAHPVFLDNAALRKSQLEFFLKLAGTDYKRVEEESRALGSLKLK